MPSCLLKFKFYFICTINKYLHSNTVITIYSIIQKGLNRRKSEDLFENASHMFDHTVYTTKLWLSSYICKIRILFDISLFLISYNVKVVFAYGSTGMELRFHIY